MSKMIIVVLMNNASGIFSLIQSVGSDTPLLIPCGSLASLDTIKNCHTKKGKLSCSDSTNGTIAGIALVASVSCQTIARPTL